MAALARIHGQEGESLGLIANSTNKLGGLAVAQVFEQGLHEFLTEFTRCNAAIALAISNDYRFLR